MMREYLSNCRFEWVDACADVYFCLQLTQIDDYLNSVVAEVGYRHKSSVKTYLDLLINRQDRLCEEYVNRGSFLNSQIPIIYKTFRGVYSHINDIKIVKIVLSELLLQFRLELLQVDRIVDGVE